jgi:hypothetical protein
MNKPERREETPTPPPFRPRALRVKTGHRAGIKQKVVEHPSGD